MLPFLIASELLATLPAKIKSLRVDPGYFYDLFPGMSAQQIAWRVVEDAEKARINTLFIYAYNSYWGAYYPTNYPNSLVEEGLGKLDIFGLLLKAAQTKNIAIVAAMPLNDFRPVWEKYPSWRSKNASGGDYRPFTHLHLLSAYHRSFRSWLQGLYQDFLTRYPGVSGIEAVEPMVDYFWNKDADYNSAATLAFRNQFPQGVIGSNSWLKFRAQGLTDLLSIMSIQAHYFGKKSFVVQTWTAAADGTLMAASILRDGFGFDFDGIANLQGTKKIDYLMAEIIWQQWAAEYGRKIFSPQWTRQAANSFLSWLGNRASPLLHVEISDFEGNGGVIEVNSEEFATSLRVIQDFPAAGVDIYDYAQILSSNSWGLLENM